MTEAVAAKVQPAGRPAATTFNGLPVADNHTAEAGGQAGQVIATVNNRPIPYSAWIHLLQKTHGLREFQYILGAELARQAAEAKGIVLTEDQLNQALKDEIAQVAGPDQDPSQQQRLLEAVLARKGVTMDEFRLLSRRNAYLRRIVEPIVERSITDEAMKAEFDRLYGEKVRVRHIQLSDSKAVTKVLAALDDGMDFAEAARRFSQNIESAQNGGELLPFSKMDPAAPPALRELAFATPVGNVAGPVRIEGSSHIIMVEQRIPAQNVKYEAVARQVRQSLKQQLVLEQMQQLLRNMIQSAVIQIEDPDLRREFQAVRGTAENVTE